MIRFSALILFSLHMSYCIGSPRSIKEDPSGIMGDDLEVDINGNLYVLDRQKNTVRRYSKDRVLLAEVGGSGWGENEFDRPSGIWARNGIDVFVADEGNHRIQRFDRNLNLVSSFFARDRINPEERFGYPADVALSRLGDLYICDGENYRVIKLDGFSKVERNFGGFDAGKGRLRRPRQLEIGPRDRVYVVDASRVIVFDSFGNFVRQVAEGSFKEKVTIFADNNGLVVRSRDTLFVFDREDRLRGAVSLEAITSVDPKTIRTLSFSRETLYVLTDDGIMTFPDPRQALPERLD